MLRLELKQSTAFKGAKQFFPKVFRKELFRPYHSIRLDESNDRVLLLGDCIRSFALFKLNYSGILSRLVDF